MHKSSWQWKEQVREKSSQTDFAINHKIRKNASSNSDNKNLLHLFSKSFKLQTNSTDVFLAMKRTSVWKIIPNGLCYRPQSPKSQLGSFENFTNGHFSLRLTFAITLLLNEHAIAWSGHPLTRLLIKILIRIDNRKLEVTPVYIINALPLIHSKNPAFWLVSFLHGGLFTLTTFFFLFFSLVTFSIIVNIYCLWFCWQPME